ncbi:MAG: outer membrane protein assembly factor BamA [Methylobacteriaceae bacterium]|nr:outer membrane protein assembly factor BamA [Methylobacteriaceae bacterium]
MVRKCSCGRSPGRKRESAAMRRRQGSGTVRQMHLTRSLLSRLAFAILVMAGLAASAQMALAQPDGTRINRVAFEGNSNIKSEQLLTVVELKSHGIFNAATAELDVRRIKEAYRRGGRNAASVSYRTVPLPDGRIDVVYTIDEGVKTGVKEINFVGNQVFSGYKLRSLMQTTESNFLSWLKTSDVYDPQRVADDEELIRRYYLRNGYADFRIVSTNAVYDPDRKGYIITITLDEGPQYRVSNVTVESRIASVDGPSLSGDLRLSAGDAYDATEVEKTLEALTRDVQRRGFAFVQVRPRGDRDPVNHTIAIGFVVDEGPRVYIERINIRGNTRTRDYVIRREFDIGEGDPYNRVLIDKAERRLNNLGFFKKVRITNEPGSSPDRVIIDVEVEDQPTGSFGISGGYSTIDGIVGEVSISESNFLGRGQYVRLAVTEGQYTRGVDLSFTEPYFLDRRIAAGFDLFHKEVDASQFSDYATWLTGGTMRFGPPFTDEITLTPRYSLYTTQIRIENTPSAPFDDCTNPIIGTTPGTTGAAPLSATANCLTNGEASLAVKQATGSTLTSLVGYTITYNTLDNYKNPTDGFHAELRQDFAGVGGDSEFIRTTGDIRYYHELLFDDWVGIARLQGGYIQGFGKESTLRISDQFQIGPDLVRGFAPGGIGPRDISAGINFKENPLGGTQYFGGSLELQFPLGLPRELGMKGAVFADAGTLFGYKGATNLSPLLGLPAGTACFPGNTAPNFTQSNCVTVRDSSKIRSSVGASLIWASPLGPIRFDYAFVLSKDKYDDTQAFRFSGGTTF